MSADVIERLPASALMSDHDAIRDGFSRMREKHGTTFHRLSQNMLSLEYVLEGWLEQPEDQGPLPDFDPGDVPLSQRGFGI